MGRDSFSELLETVEDLDWIVISGLSVKIYSGSDREFDDIDFIVREEDIDEFAERLDTVAEDRDFVKNGVEIDDHAFETVFHGIEVEGTSGYPPKRVREGTLKKLFQEAVEKEFRGETVRLAPLEDLLVLKTWIYREKDKRDLELLNHLEVNSDFLLELIDDWGLERDMVLSRLEEAGIHL